MESEKVIFADDFQHRLSTGWTWAREDPELWRLTKDGLLIHTVPGGIWNDSQTPARNILLRSLSDNGTAIVSSDLLPSTYAVEVSVKLRPEVWGACVATRSLPCAFLTFVLLILLQENKPVCFYIALMMIG